MNRIQRKTPDKVTLSPDQHHRVSTDRAALPCKHYGLCSWSIPDKFLYRESLVNPLRLTQLYSLSARCNVHNGWPPPKLIKFSTLGRSISMINTVKINQSLQPVQYEHRADILRAIKTSSFIQAVSLNNWKFYIKTGFLSNLEL